MRTCICSIPTFHGPEACKNCMGEHFGDFEINVPTVFDEKSARRISTEEFDKEGRLIKRTIKYEKED